VHFYHEREFASEFTKICLAAMLSHDLAAGERYEEEMSMRCWDGRQTTHCEILRAAIIQPDVVLQKPMTTTLG